MRLGLILLLAFLSLPVRGADKVSYFQTRRQLRHLIQKDPKTIKDPVEQKVWVQNMYALILLERLAGWDKLAKINIERCELLCKKVLSDRQWQVLQK